MQNPGILDFVIRLSFSPCVSRLSFRVLFSFQFAPFPFVIPLASSRVLSTFRFGSSSAFISRSLFSFGSHPCRLLFRVSRLSFRVFGFHFAPALFVIRSASFSPFFAFPAFHFASSDFICTFQHSVRVLFAFGSAFPAFRFASRLPFEPALSDFRFAVLSAFIPRPSRPFRTCFGFGFASFRSTLKISA